MVKQITREIRLEVVRRWLLGDGNSKIEKDVDIAESSVRNILGEFREGRFPELTQFVPHAEAIHGLAQELTTKNLSVGQASVALVVFTGLQELNINPADLQAILEMLRKLIGSTPPAEFGRAVGQLAQLQVEAKLSFKDLEGLIVKKKSELEDLSVKVKAATDAADAAKAKETEANASLERTLKQNNVTRQSLEEYISDKRRFTEAGISLDDVKTLSAFIKTAKSEGFVKAAKELADIEAKTGMSHDALLAQYRQTQENLTKLQTNVIHLSDEVHGLTLKVADLKKQEADQLTSNNLTKQQLEEYLALIARMKKAGISFDA